MLVNYGYSNKGIKNTYEAALTTLTRLIKLFNIYYIHVYDSVTLPSNCHVIDSVCRSFRFVVFCFYRIFSYFWEFYFFQFWRLGTEDRFEKTNTKNKVYKQTCAIELRGKHLYLFVYNYYQLFFKVLSGEHILSALTSRYEKIQIHLPKT